MGKNNKIVTFFLVSICIFQLQGCGGQKNNKIEVINIGYQSVTAQTWGALIMKDSKSFEKKLKNKFPDKNFEIKWHDETSGAVINSNMIADKYQIGFMGDMPCLINGSKGLKSSNYKSVLIAMDGKGVEGKNQSILVSSKSNIKSVKDLKGKTIAVPIGSSAHRMVLSILEKYNLKDKVNILHQEINTASQLLVSGKVDAIGVWEPYARYLEKSIGAKVLVDGCESKNDYLDGIMVNKKWAESNREIVVCFLEALINAHSELNKNDKNIVQSIRRESIFDKDISSNVIKNIRWDVPIYKKDIDTLQGDVTFLNSIKKIDNFNVNNIIDTSYLEQAFKNLKIKTTSYDSKDYPNEKY